jgi:4'-phosphopantetheinyl transferase EntD
LFALSPQGLSAPGNLDQAIVDEGTAATRPARCAPPRLRAYHVTTMIYDAQTSVGEPGTPKATGPVSVRSRLFPPAVVTVELIGEALPDTLTPTEYNSISHCADKRINDFRRGRACAHQGLSELGLPQVSVLAGSQREPLWPSGIVGSITHTTGFAAAVVARRAEIEAVGIDCEVIESVSPELWERICTPEERKRLAGLPEPRAQQEAALIFAAKEAFYKCQFPLSHEWVGFEDVAMEVSDDGTFRIIPRACLPVADRWVAALMGRYEYREGWVVTGVTALICA